MHVYGCPNTRSVRVVWALEEAGARYDYTRIDLGQGQGQSPEFLKVNPGGKVPALIDGDDVITESAAICVWVGERFPEARLVPAVGTAARASFLRWLCFAVTELEQALWTIAKHKFALPEERRVPAIIDTARWEYARAMSVLDEGLDGREFIAGERFSVADILVAHTLAWGRKAASGLETPKVAAYGDRLLARPALARARERESG
ncbi:MAG: glutathione S-transferase family protein [Ectothiorhodospiraceae bacterium]|nr:glutathione S-transferase family protein [Ectothiorhodospiraceae bacterium]